MNKSKNKLTFAERAKKLIKKYPRADFDKIEKDQLDRDLAALSKEQEEYKASKDMTGTGNNKQFATGGFTSINNIGELTEEANRLNSIYGDDYEQSFQSNNLAGMSPAAKAAVTMGVSDDNSTSDRVSTSKGMLPEDSLSPYQTSIIPSIASGALTTGANLLMARNTDKNLPELNLNRLSPEEISLARERSGVRRQANTAGRIARSNAAKGSRTRGEYLSTAAAGEAGLNRGTSEALSQLYSQEAKMNAAERARIAQTNAQIEAQEAAANLGIKRQARADKDAYTSAAIQTIPQVMSNVTGIRQQDALINSLGQDYSIAQYQDPDLNWFEKILKPKQTVRKYNNKNSK